MKVCLVTYSRSYNYGAALQLFATYSFLEKCGCTVEVLDYQNAYEAGKVASKNGVDLLKLLRTFISSTIFGSKRNSERNFALFYNSMRYSVPVSSIAEVEKLDVFDLFVVGSDQVWNPTITDGFDKVFCLDSSKIANKISYASSMGSVNFSDFDCSSLKSGLSRFSHISVREEIAKSYLNNLIDNDIEIVIDPTMLFTKDEWINLLNLPATGKSIQEKYVLIYALGNSFEELNKIAKKIAKDIGAKTAVISLSNRPKKVDFLMNRATPNDFVELISGAEFVVTNSFHGTCFSLIFERPFYSVIFNSNPSRSVEMLTRYGLVSRIYKRGDSINMKLFSNEDIQAASSAIGGFRNFSRNWLNDAIWGDPDE